MSEDATLEKPESWLCQLLGLINPVIVMASNIVGGYWVASGVIYMLGLGPLLDVLFGRASKPKPPRESGRPFEALLYVTPSFNSQYWRHYCIVPQSMARLGQHGLRL